MNKDDVAGLVELKKLQKDAGIPHLPTQLTYQLRRAVAGYGTLAYQWADKPHRLVYDACREIEAQADTIEALQARIEALEAALRDLLPEAINDRYATQSDAVKNAQSLLEGVGNG